MSLPWPDLTTEEWEQRLRAVREARTKPVSLGGAGSGNFGHAGRPGEVGGSGIGGARLFDRNPKLENYRAIPVVRSEGAGGGRHPEAEVHGGKIHLYPKFDALSPEMQDFVFAHEIGHAVLDEHGLSTMIADADRLGIDPWDSAALPFGQSNMHEAFADTFASLHTKDDVSARYPKWAKLVGRIAKQHQPKKLTYRDKLAFLLGGEGSGNFGHAGRPGEVGGSATEGEDHSPIDKQHHEFVALVKAAEDIEVQRDVKRAEMVDAWKVFSEDVQNRKPRPLKPDGAAAKRLDSYKQAKSLEEQFHKDYEEQAIRQRALHAQAIELLKVPASDRSSVTFRESEQSPLHPGVANSAKRALATFRQFDGSGAFVPIAFPADKVEQFREIFGYAGALKENPNGTFAIPSTLTLEKTTSKRAHATLSGIAISGGGGGQLEETVYHEVAHHIEMKSSAVLRAAVEFRESMANKPREVYKLNTGDHKSLDDSEVAVRGKFPDPYSAKVYPDDIATEIVSTGVASYISDPVQFARSRPEHFKFIFDVMHGKYKGKY